jgi:hypothetical protein
LPESASCSFRGLGTAFEPVMLARLWAGNRASLGDD